MQSSYRIKIYADAAPRVLIYDSGTVAGKSKVISVSVAGGSSSVAMAVMAVVVAVVAVVYTCVARVCVRGGFKCGGFKCGGCEVHGLS